jgi:hypothetical protein
MSDVTIVKPKKKRGRPAIVPTDAERDAVMSVLRDDSGPEGFVARTKKELATMTGLNIKLVAKILDSEPDVDKVGSKKGTKYKII